jgi:hypothetical protein
MKLRKAIKLAAAGAIVGAVPMLAQAATGITTGNASPLDGSLNCTVDGAYTCETLVTDAGFVMYRVTDAGAANTFYVTGIVDNAEGNFSSISVVGEETNTVHNNGVWNKTDVSEIGVGDDDFVLSTTVTTGSYSDGVTVGAAGSNTATAAGHQTIDILEHIYDNTDSNAFNTGFDYTKGTIDGSGGVVYETFDINLAVNAGAATDAGGSIANTFQILQTVIDATAGGAYVDLAGKTLMIDQLVNEDAAGDTFVQSFKQNEATGSAVFDNGTITAGPAGEATVTFAAGDTLAVKTLSQTMNGAVANFGLSDAANEDATGTNNGAGVDNFAGTTGMSATFDNNAGDPFVTF